MSTQFQLPDPVARRTLGDAVYDRLLQGILEGQLASGDELSEVTLAERYQVSRTPVREALARLVADGLVSNGPNRKATVLTFSRQLVVEIYQVRQFLEAGAAELASNRFNPGELARLQTAAENIRPGTDHLWQERALAFDLDLHRTIARQCGNRRLEIEIRRCTNFMPILQRLAGRRDDRLQLAYDEHLRILDALAAGDAKRASREMREHVASALAIVLKDVYPDL
jgi:DNA-binding GntR family transcriptional regulator